MENTQELDFDSICRTFGQYPITHGYHSLGFLEAIRPDIHWIFLIHNVTWRVANPISSSKLCDQLDIEIAANLALERPVCLVIWDENIPTPPAPTFVAVCNRYRDENFFLITQFGPKQQLLYTYQGELRCKILEIPWFFLNDIIGYYKSRILSDVKSPNDSKKNFLLMTNRWQMQQHKIDLMEFIIKKDLHEFGLITVHDLARMSKIYNHDSIIETLLPAYPKEESTEFDKMAAQTKIGDMWISHNVENFLRIESYYDMPLIITAESRIGIFLASEKSIWPALLGRMYLIYGQPGSMGLTQRWHDVDQTEWADLEFDSHEGDWSRQANLERLDLMLDRNRYLIMHAREIYHSIRDKLERARWTIGPNILRFCLDQLDRIPRL